jgi:hypothetical protein
VRTREATSLLTAPPSYRFAENPLLIGKVIVTPDSFIRAESNVYMAGQA